MVAPIVKYWTKEPQPNAWIKWFNRRTMFKNQNNLVSFVGKTGSGKTWSAISVAEMISQDNGVPFGIDNIVFSLTELMELINSNKLQKGSTIIFDEPQCSISSRDFQSDANKIFNYLLTTFRHRNLSLFFCTPFESLLDKSTRKLFHAKVETHKIDKDKKLCVLKPRYLEYVDYKEDPLRQRLIVNTMKGHYKVTTWSVPKPSDEIIDLYEKKKMDFTNRLNQNIAQRLEKYEEKGKGVTGKSGGILEPEPIQIPPTKREVIEDLMRKGYLKPKKIKELTGFSSSTINGHMQTIKREQKMRNLLENVRNSTNLVKNASISAQNPS